MSQYLAGNATVTNGSPTVTGTNTLWLANVTAGDSFTIASTGVMYDVASVDSDTQVTLSVAYAGVTASGAVYTIARDFTSPDDFPELTTGDIETPTIITRALRKIQSRFAGIAINTTAEIGQAVNDHVALPDPHSQYAELSGGADANFAVMPQVSGDPIVESGSNADGEWTRWSDGKQTCESPQTVMSFNNKSNINFSWSYPAAFISTPTVVPILVYEDFHSNYRTATTTLQYVRLISTTDAAIGLASDNAWIQADAAGDPMQGLASGRWK